MGRPPAVEHSVSYLRFSRVRALPRPDSSTRFDSSDRNASSAGVCLAIRRVVSYGGWFLLVSSIAAAYQAQSCMRLLEVEIEEDAILKLACVLTDAFAGSAELRRTARALVMARPRVRGLY